MKRFGLLLAMVMVSLMVAAGGWAGVKSFVASYGLDSNPCTQVSPCRSFAHAVSVTDEGGEVIVLDTGGYGSVTITKSISLIAPVGMYASITPSSGTNGITINAAADDKVLIKGLTIKGTSGSLSGIRAASAGALTVDNCFISGLGGPGIHFAAPNSEFIIVNSKISNNSDAVYIGNSSGLVSVSMNHVEMVANDTGLTIFPSNTGSVSATVTNSLGINNHGTAFYNGGNTAGTSVLNLENCIAHGNNYAVDVVNNSASDVTRLSDCTVTQNIFGVYRSPGYSGTIYSLGNNTLAGNNTNTNVSPTLFSTW